MTPKKPRKKVWSWAKATKAGWDKFTEREAKLGRSTSTHFGFRSRQKRERESRVAMEDVE